MAEYIWREAAIKAVEKADYTAISSDADDCKADYLRAIIESVPAADVVPVVHGRWGTGRFNLETGNYEEQCTRCRNFSKEYGKPYCPNCGAKMDGGEDND